MQLNNIQQILHDTFGHKSFRGQQQQVIEHLIDGNDALVVMATAAGKSLCFQLAGLVREGITVVISPLIALMKQQVQNLEQLGLKAVCVHAALRWQEVEELESQLLMGELDYLYLSPEKLLNKDMQDLLHRLDISLFAIDEAHCIWRWGEHFRPEYQQLSFLAEEFPRVPRVALTATAGKHCRAAIINELALQHARVFEDELDRKNIYYWVQPKKGAKQQLLNFLQLRHRHHCGIVYCQTRKKVELITDYLNSQGFSAGFYHAGMTSEHRWQMQKHFLKGEIKIMVATVAFGMGINKPDIRFVAHMDLPRNLESYYQETGRAGRDGLSADAWMVFGLRDVQLLSQWIESGHQDENFKQWERAQLAELLHYTIDGQCRRKNLLSVFGLTFQNCCHHCDNCNKMLQPEQNNTVAAQALSAVYRCGQKTGIDYLIKILRGKTVKAVVENDHQKLSVFGVGKDFSEIYWRAVFFQLLKQGAIQLHGDYYDQVKLTFRSKPLLNQSTSFTFYTFHFFSTRDYHSQYRFNPALNHATELFEMLYQKRSQLAANNNLLDYQIVLDNSLHDLCVQLPLQLKQLTNIEGFASETIRLYGKQFIGVIARYRQQQQNQLEHLLALLEVPVSQQQLENYALAHHLTLQQLAHQIAGYIQLGLIRAETILPISRVEIELLENGWPFSQADSAYRLARDYLLQHENIAIDPCWIPCFFAEFAQNHKKDP